MTEIKGRKFTKEEIIAEKKAKAEKRAKVLRSVMHVTVEEWVEDVKVTRQEL